MRTDEWLWLLPTRHLLYTVRAQLLEGQAGGMDIPLLTFDDVAKRLVRHVEPNVQLLTPYAREKMVEALIERHADDPHLAVFHPILDQPGLHRSVAHAIGEMKRSGLREEDVRTYLNRGREDDALSEGRQRALAFLFLRYQETLRHRDGVLWVDPEEMLCRACDILERRGSSSEKEAGEGGSPFSSIHTLWVDHFTDFTPLQMRLLRSLIHVSDEVGIYVPFPREKEEWLPQLSKQLEDTRQSLAQLGLQFVDLGECTPSAAVRKLKDDWLPSASFSPTVSDHVLQQETIIGEDGRYLAPAGLACLPACTAKREVETVAKEIKRLVRLEGIAPGDVAVVFNDERYERLLHEVMQQNGVPLYNHEHIRLSETALVRQVLALIHLAVTDWERRDVLNLAQGGYFRWQCRPPHGLETLVKRLGIGEGRKAWREALLREQKRLEWREREVAYDVWEDEERGRLRARWERQKETIRRTLSWLEEVEGVVFELERAPSWQERIEQIERLGQRLDIEGQIRRLWSSALERGEVQGYRRDIEAYRILGDVLLEMKRLTALMPRETIRSWPALVRELSHLLAQQRVTVTRGEIGGVHLFDPSAIRGTSFAAVFILGLNEGSFPSHHSEDWLIRDAERVAFLGGRARLPASYAHNEMEQLFFEMAVRSARKHLILSYVSPQADEHVLRSRFVEQLEQQYAPGPWQAPARFQDAMESRLFPTRRTDISSLREYENWMMATWGMRGTPVEALSRDGDPLFREQEERIRKLMEHAEIEKERRGERPGRWDGHLIDPRIHERLQQEFSTDRAYSVSWLNDYAACPLHFFFARVLGVQPLEEAEEMLSPLDAGHVLHEVLRRLFSRNKGRHMVEKPLKDWEVELAAAFDDVASEWETERPHAFSALWPLERERLYRTVKSWLRHEYARLGRRRFKPCHLEFSFGLSTGDHVDEVSTERPLTLSLGGETLHLVGRIDRVDFDAQGNFVLYDYKWSTTRYRGCHQMDETNNFQLPLYVLAFQSWLEEQGRQGKPVGACFYGLRAQDKFAKIGLWEKGSLSDLGLSTRTRAGVTEDVAEAAQTVLPRVVELFYGIRHGRFYMQPEHEPHPYYGDPSLYRQNRWAQRKGDDIVENRRP